MDNYESQSLHSRHTSHHNEEPSFLNESKSKNTASYVKRLNDDETDELIKSIYTALKVILDIIYSFLPIFIIFYALRIYLEPISLQDIHYYPDFSKDLKGEKADMNVEFYDLMDYESSSNGWQNEERVLFLVPLRDASSHLPMFFGHLTNMSYPHNLIDISFLISDTTDSTVPNLEKFLEDYQNSASDYDKFGNIEIYEKDFGQIVGQSFSDRHGFQAQGPRRKKMAIARNWLLSTAIKPYHSWVYWRDIDVETCPTTILEDLMHHDKDVIVPNVWRPLPDWLGGEQAYDLNSWQESEGGIELADKLDEDAVIVEGYAEYATWRPHLAYLRDPYGDPEVEIELDGIGGVSILAKAKVFKHGGMFPAFSYKKHAETEGFGKLCKSMGFQVIGLPHYVIWHIYEPSTNDLKHMEWLANEEVRQLENLKNKIVFDKAWEYMFKDVNEDWETEKFNIFKNNDLSSLGLGKVSWEDDDEFLVEVDDDEIDDLHDDLNGNGGDQFLIAFNNHESKNFEKSVLEKLTNDGPITFGSSKNEFSYSNFGELKEHRKKPMKFKKIIVEPEESSIDNEDDDEDGQSSNDDEYVDVIDDDDVLEGKYDLNSDQVVADGDLSDRIVDSGKDKQLFDILETFKKQIDGEDEGEVEFKSKKLVKEKASSSASGSSGSSKIKKKLKSKAKRRTFYEIEDGVTIGTIVQTLATPQATNFDDANVREALDEVINLLSEKLQR